MGGKRMIKIALLAVVGALLSVQLKSGKPEYGIYVSVGVSLLLFGGIVERLGSFVTMFRNLEELSGINPEYLSILLKMIGITYVGEFASGICKDAGCQTLAVQIELFGKLTILLLSLPVLSALLETVRKFLS